MIRKIVIKIKKTPLSNDYIVLHFWELHDHISTGHMWIGKFRKVLGESLIDDDFNEFIDHIDKSWHNFEEKHKEIIGLDNKKDFTDELRKATTTYYGNSKLLQQMVDTIKEYLINDENPLLNIDKEKLISPKYTLNKDRFERMLNFLQKQIP